MGKKRRSKTVDVNSIGEEEAARLFGQATSNFMRDVAKARKRHGVDAFAIWMFHDGKMRCCSTGGDEQTRTIALNVANHIVDMSETVMEAVAQTMHTKGSA